MKEPYTKAQYCCVMERYKCARVTFGLEHNIVALYRFFSCTLVPSVFSIVFEIPRLGATSLVEWNEECSKTLLL